MHRTKKNLKFIQQYCLDNHVDISACESITSGGISFLLTSLPGSSNFFKGSLVTYQSIIKESILRIKNTPIISIDCAEKMAVGSSKMFSSKISIASTGNSGPDLLENKPKGLVFISIYIADLKQCFNKELNISSKARLMVKHNASHLAIKFLAETLKQLPNYK